MTTKIQIYESHLTSIKFNTKDNFGMQRISISKSFLQLSLFLRYDSLRKQRYESHPGINGLHLGAGNIVKR